MQSPSCISCMHVHRCVHPAHTCSLLHLIHALMYVYRCAHQPQPATTSTHTCSLSPAYSHALMFTGVRCAPTPPPACTHLQPQSCIFSCTHVHRCAVCTNPTTSKHICSLSPASHALMLHPHYTSPLTTSTHTHLHAAIFISCMHVHRCTDCPHNQHTHLHTVTFMHLMHACSPAGVCTQHTLAASFISYMHSCMLTGARINPSHHQHTHLQPQSCISGTHVHRCAVCTNPTTSMHTPAASVLYLMHSCSPVHRLSPQPAHTSGASSITCTHSCSPVCAPTPQPAYTHIHICSMQPPSYCHACSLVHEPSSPPI